MWLVGVLNPWEMLEILRRVYKYLAEKNPIQNRLAV